MVWRLKDDKAVSEPMLTQFTDANMWHKGYELTYRGLDNMVAIFTDYIFKCISLNEIAVF